MEYRMLDITLISAKKLKKATLIGKMDLYAVAYIEEAGADKSEKQKTFVDQDCGSDPSWNFPMKFKVNEAAGFQSRLTLVVEIKHEGTFGDKDVGEVQVPINELLEGVSKEGKPEEFVSYEVRTPSGKQKGDLKISYKFGVSFVEKVKEEKVKEAEPFYPTDGMAVGSSSEHQQPYPPADVYYPPAVPAGGYAYQHQQQQPGYGYAPPPQQAYGGYPPQGYQQPQENHQKKDGMGGMGVGLGVGLLGGAVGGLIIADIASDAGGGGDCGGGCGGGDDE